MGKVEAEFMLNLSGDLYKKIDGWRHLLANTYGVAVPDMDTFIAVLLERSELDLRILLWDFAEGLHVIGKLGVRSLN